MPLSPKQIEALAAAFEQELHSRLIELRLAWQGPLRGTRTAMQSLHRIAQALAGSATSFGYPALASAACAVEAQARQILENFGHTSSTHYEQLHQHLNTLAISMTHPQRQTAATAAAPTRPRDTNSHNSQDSQKRILMLCPSSAPHQALEAEFSHFGFTVQHHSPAALQAAGLEAQVEALNAVLTQTPAHVLVADVQYAALVSRAVQALAPTPALIFLAETDGLAARLDAVRAGGSAFFLAPWDATDLVDTVDKLLGSEKNLGYRVVIIEDAPSLARLYAATLEAANMRTLVVTDPMTALEQMEGFHPDLILMDIYMPHVSGVDLSRVIRQHKAYFGVPIVFLSAERDSAKQLAALGMGGDDFLVKPIEGPELIQAVSVRANRYQGLRSLMVKDSLTGLLNHSTLLRRLDHELQRAARQGTHLSFAMVDIDHFKQVNDTWGHLAGDHVILTLARLLRERLRQTDLIGRYGGEEFAVILPDTTPEEASQVLDGLRASFARIEQHAEHQVFHVTFSVGLAGFQGRTADRGILDQADAALYEAKRQGRNRLIRANQLHPENAP